ncbi:DUF6875 domain-containing protein [Nocardia otitidiscaviarum]|uniref:DUF6875 domain-containing protein n=1 Tax=Nocardia otitidiscaviarum TaxID=1823 RepID=A0A516NN77_9NOCA|nr:hypothetical protein [Nocardia otitidiscaviarum]MBF6181175.1 hypothetical protein [Nocardia otitidiscaviarum]MCP9619465.1 hypothetical protein [Nocardia otitidiscaviarum]QDP80351.1 hypothetical protein FOH10_18145 [Nocardia otitidiscaviarum]
MRSGPRSGVHWWNVYADPEAWERQGPAAAALVGWMADHLAQPHPELGRPGPVCPFVRHSADRQVVWAGCASGGDGLTEERMHSVLDDAFEVYAALRQENPSEPARSTLITLFPGLTRYDLIDAVHAARKTEIVGQGLMLGQFYPGCPVPGLWNRDFRPLDAPVPMLVLRPMMSTDFPFLVARTDWLYAYFTRFAPDLPRTLRWAVAERMLVSGQAAGDITDLRVHSADEHAR